MQCPHALLSFWTVATLRRVQGTSCNETESHNYEFLFPEENSTTPLTAEADRIGIAKASRFRTKRDFTLIEFPGTNARASKKQSHSGDRN